MSKPLVSIILLTYNSQKYVESCLEALEKVTYPNLEILLIDNHSDDRTLSIAHRHLASIKIFSRQENDGYAGGHNFGLRKAQGKFVFLMNPDTTVTSDFLEPLVDVMEKDENIAACQPLVYLAMKRNTINLTGKVPHYLGFDWLRDFESEKVRPSGQVSSISGSGVLIRSTALTTVGGLDTNYFMYYEDSDLSWRLRLAGFKLWYCAESLVYHDYKLIPDGETQTLRSKLYWAERNRLYTIFRNYSTKTLLLITPIFIVMELALLVYFTTKGWLGAKLRSYLSLWRSRQTLLLSRREVQTGRVVNDHEISKDYVSLIDFSLFRHPLLTYVLNPLLLCYWKLILPLV